MVSMQWHRQEPARKGRWARPGVALGVLASFVAGCGSQSGQRQEPERSLSGPVAALYVVDHRGASPKGNALAPYFGVFDRVQTGCAMSPDALGNRILELATEASNGSGTRVTNLEALRAVAGRLRSNDPNCPSIFAETQALLGGSTVG
jgi:hypothetical protein